MEKYKVTWVRPRPEERESHSEGMGLDEAWDACMDLWENGHSDARVEPDDDAVDKTASWLGMNCVAFR